MTPSGTSSCNIKTAQCAVSCTTSADLATGLHMLRLDSSWRESHGGAAVRNGHAFFCPCSSLCRLQIGNRQVKIDCAEGVRFELTRPFGLPVFKTGAINRSATPPGKLVISDR